MVDVSAGRERVAQEALLSSATLCASNVAFLVKTTMGRTCWRPFPPTQRMSQLIPVQLVTQHLGGMTPPKWPATTCEGQELQLYAQIRTQHPHAQLLTNLDNE